MEVRRVPAGVYAANCYILMDEETKEAAVMDPGGDADDLSKVIKEMGAKVKYILLTHGHVDHVGAVTELKDEFKAPVYINEEDYKMISNREYIYGDIIGKVDGYINEGDSFKLGSSEIKVLQTPGHTPGGVCFLVDNMVITGDTLFAGSIGRTDLGGGDYEAIIRSIKEKLMILPDDTIVLSGHGGQSTIGRERVHNPFL
ncbi:MBL fold metallo-hydrolase [Clostridium sp. CX1]|uniref:MBL fold metallo-hydrolase n=1 Tax=Clostridium tanneri TaxID=3037988 RepID=A0ABU4JPM5_9CLOT|nr:MULTISPECIES: MBL fold metallo-hydrolase [unclassified Clostridium]MCT8977167.1 MBL fold metallo-hydrolase [Clostridium sp. CX1]MDW8799911.1 MBL fold metallo-hydrolase [Clostridium sp. A1-XYC3]